MRMRTKILRGMALIAVTGMFAACSDDDGPTIPIDDQDDAGYAAVQSVLTADCGGCHGENSGRSFKVTMDSATFVASGFINPANPDLSLIFTKPRSANAHGGGVVANYTDADIAQIRGWVTSQPVLNLTTLQAVPVGSRVAPNFDGYASEAVWRSAPTTVARIGGGWADAEEVILSAAYDTEYIYVLATWIDDAESALRAPWVKQADGSWVTMSPKPTPPAGIDWDAFKSVTFEEESSSFFYEDKLAFIWNTTGTSAIAGFDEQGCAVVCHDPANGYGPGTTYNYTDANLAAKKYTNSPLEIGDMWHWKYVRQNQHYKIDDQHVNYWSQGGPDPAHAGRHADTGSGGYASNPSVNGFPQYRGPSLTAPPYFILDTEKVELTLAELAGLPVGAMLPNMITKGPNGTRADIDAHGVYNPATKTWTVEIRRKLVTGDPNDVQFADLNREYSFGVAVFDNAQIEHSWSGQAYQLKFVN